MEYMYKLYTATWMPHGCPEKHGESMEYMHPDLGKYFLRGRGKHVHMGHP